MTQRQEKTRVLGFTLYLKEGKWYAAKRLGGHLRWVYVGEGLDKAEEKVRAFCVKHGISVRTEAEVIVEDFSEKLAKEAQELKTVSQAVENRLVVLEKENLELRNRLEKLEKKKVESRTKVISEKKEEKQKEKPKAKEVGKLIALGQMILGFKVLEKTARGMKQYQGYRRNGGKQCYVYLCPSAKPVTLKEAQEKIRQYCEKHNVGL